MASELSLSLIRCWGNVDGTELSLPDVPKQLRHFTNPSPADQDKMIQVDIIDGDGLRVGTVVHSVGV